jgi:hypothetical protein
MEPIWAQVVAVLPDHPAVDPVHPLGCHRRRIPDRVAFEHVVAALVHGSGYERIATSGCSDRTIRRRVHEWAEAGLAQEVHALVLARNDRMIGIELEDVAVIVRYRTQLEDVAVIVRYRTHPEAKSLGPDGTPCHCSNRQALRGTGSVMRAMPIGVVSSRVYRVAGTSPAGDSHYFPCTEEPVLADRSRPSHALHLDLESGLGRLGLFDLALLDIEFLVAVLCLEDHGVHLGTEQQHGG